MKRITLLLGSIIVLYSHCYSQKIKAVKPRIESCDCNFKMDSVYLSLVPPALKTNTTFQKTFDSSFTTTCGYLLVPENRSKSSAKTIKLPFIILHSKNPGKKKDPVLFTSGGPGNSSLNWINGMAKSSVILDRDCIAFEQRGTRFAIPYLRNVALDNALKESYRKNLNKDSMWLVGVKKYKQNLEKRGIDLDGYNSDESVSDIHDLLSLLKIDSVNLFGGSYSGGLMLSVLQKDPARVRSLVLDSPLPTFAPIDEDEPMHFMEALSVLSRNCEKDSTDKVRYGNLQQKFETYFNRIKDSVFYLPYADQGSNDTLQIQYTKNDLLLVIVDNLLNPSTIKDVPYVITEIISGSHFKYIKPRIERILTKYPAPDGMRMLVYCADQANYHSETVIQQLYVIYPFLKDFRINDVWKAVCDCWKNKPVNSTSKQPFYSLKPALIGDGEMDAACSPRYMSMIKHYMPNSQCFLFTNKGHGVGGKDWHAMTQEFLDNPYKKIVPGNITVTAF